MSGYPQADSPVLPRRLLALFACPALALAGIGLPLTVLLPNYYAAELGLNLSAVGLAFVVVRLMDIGVDPVLGVLMDRTRSPWGRFRPWLVAGTPVLMLAVALLFFARPGVSGAYLTVGLLVAYGGWAMCVLAQSAWGAVLSGDYNQRSRIYNWWQGANLVGLLLILLVPLACARAGLGSRQDSMHVMGWVLLAMLPLTTAIAALSVPEPAHDAAAPLARLRDWAALFKLSAVRRIMAIDLILGLSFGLQASIFLFYFQAFKNVSPIAANSLLLIYFLAGLAGGPLWVMLANRIGKHAALAASCLVYIAGLAGLFLIPSGSLVWAAPAAIFAGLPYGAPSLLSRAMMADAADEELLRSGVDRTGLLFAVLNTSTKIGPMAAGLAFVGLDRAGFRAGSAHNSPGSLAALALLFLAGPAILNLVAALSLIGYPLTARRHAEIRAALEAQTHAV